MRSGNERMGRLVPARANKKGQRSRRGFSIAQKLTKIIFPVIMLTLNTPRLRLWRRHVKTRIKRRLYAGMDKNHVSFFVFRLSGVELELLPQILVGARPLRGWPSLPTTPLLLLSLLVGRAGESGEESPGAFDSALAIFFKILILHVIQVALPALKFDL